MVSVGGIFGLLIIGIISTCSGNVRCDEEVMPTTIELPKDNPYNLPDIAIEEDGKKATNETTEDYVDCSVAFLNKIETPNFTL